MEIITAINRCCNESSVHLRDEIRNDETEVVQQIKDPLYDIAFRERTMSRPRHDS